MLSRLVCVHIQLQRIHPNRYAYFEREGGIVCVCVCVCEGEYACVCEKEVGGE
jgi:hypothetical protein